MGLGSGIRKKPIPDPGSGGQKGTGSRIRIRNTERKFGSQMFWQYLVNTAADTVLVPYPSVFALPTEFSFFVYYIRTVPVIGGRT